jgi:hypothetical protein
MCKLRILLAILYENSARNIFAEIHPDIVAYELLEDFAGANVCGYQVRKQRIVGNWRRRVVSGLGESGLIKPSGFHYFDTDVCADVASLYIARIRGDDVEIISPCSGRGEAAAAAARDSTIGPYIIYH